MDAEDKYDIVLDFLMEEYSLTEQDAEILLNLPKWELTESQ